MSNDNNINNLHKKSSNETSPIELDNFILNQAKQSCKPVKVKKLNRWLYALPTAAVLLVSFSLITNLQHENQEMMTVPTYIKVKDQAVMLPEKIERKNYQDTNKLPLEPHGIPSASSAPAPTFTQTQQPKLASDSIISAKTSKIRLQKQILLAPKAKTRKKMEAAKGSLNSGLIGNSLSAGSDSEENIIIQKPTPVIEADYGSSASIELEGYSDSKEIIAEDDTPSIDNYILQLEKLIKENRLAEAKALIIDISQHHPDYSFSKYKDVLGL